MPALGLEQRVVDLDLEADLAKRLEIACLEARRNARRAEATFLQQLRRKQSAGLEGPRFLVARL